MNVGASEPEHAASGEREEAGTRQRAVGGKETQVSCRLDLAHSAAVRVVTASITSSASGGPTRSRRDAAASIVRNGQARPHELRVDSFAQAPPHRGATATCARARTWYGYAARARQNSRPGRDSGDRSIGIRARRRRQPQRCNRGALERSEPREKRKKPGPSRETYWNKLSNAGRKMTLSLRPSDSSRARCTSADERS